MDLRDNPNYYKQERPYKDKYICGSCRKCFKRKVASDIDKEINEQPAKCPQCGSPTMWVGPKFEPPKSTELMAWKSIEIMRRIGYLGFFGYASNQVIIPKGMKELKNYLQKLHSELDTTIDDGGLSVNAMNFKTTLQNRIESEIKKLASS